MKKALPILLILSLLVNGLLAWTLLRQPAQEEQLHKAHAIQELAAGVRDLERYQATRWESDYLAAAAHLHAACLEVERLREVDYTVTTEPFQNLRTLALSWPDVIKDDLDTVIPALARITREDHLTDEACMEEFKVFTQDLQHRAIQAEVNAAYNEDHP